MDFRKIWLINLSHKLLLDGGPVVLSRPTCAHVSSVVLNMKRVSRIESAKLSSGFLVSEGVHRYLALAFFLSKGCLPVLPFREEELFLLFVTEDLSKVDRKRHTA